jgi:alcohol dehydrogenase
MKAAVVSEPFGVDHLKIEEVEAPVAREGEVLVRVTRAGLNPVDVNVIRKKILYNLKPVPHIPGSEAVGTVEEDSGSFKKGQRVIIYPRIFDGTCEMCLSGREYMCQNGGIFGVASNGGYCEMVSVPYRNVMPYSGEISEDTASGLSVGALTAYHALKRVRAEAHNSILVYGASGNTGIFAIQLAGIMGMEVSAVSGKPWISDYINGTLFDEYSKVSGTYDIVMNSLGAEHFKGSMEHVAPGGSLVTFGVLTGSATELDIGSVYTRERSVIGATGGTRKELQEILGIMKNHEIRMPVEKTLPLEMIHYAFELFQKRNSGRILIKPSQ